jgi:dimethylamine--corrinoid protein Co-methyltransferase
MGVTLGHHMASGMNGIRTAGDLVLRMEMQGMRINEAKKYVAGKLGVDVLDLADPYKMTEVRNKLGLGTVLAIPGEPKGMRAKANIAEVLDIEISCLNKL